MAPKTNAFAANLPRARRALLAWYKTHGRHDLPWRITRDPYHVYVSEIMLQQTQVKTVLDRFYGPFLKKFPTLKVLAQASPEAVSKAWEGLGYYRRARHLHQAAKLAGETLPATVEGLLALPGIGRNTANAVACFGFGARVPVMEANVKRVLARVYALKTPDEKTLWEKAHELLDVKNAYDYNQAMMDIGALVCTPRNPRCSMCPLNIICKGQATPELYPAPKKAKTVPIRKRIIVAFHDGQGRYYINRRSGEFLNGLYGFAEFDGDAKAVIFSGKTYKLSKTVLIGAATQTYSHFRLDAKVYTQTVTKPSSYKGIKATVKEMKSLPLSRIDLKVVALLPIIC